METDYISLFHMQRINFMQKMQTLCKFGLICSMPPHVFLWYIIYIYIWCINIRNSQRKIVSTIKFFKVYIYWDVNIGKMYIYWDVNIGKIYS